jgi:hypothetical protein
MALRWGYSRRPLHIYRQFSWRVWRYGCSGTGDESTGYELAAG